MDIKYESVQNKNIDTFTYNLRHIQLYIPQLDFRQQNGYIVLIIYVTNSSEEKKKKSNHGNVTSTKKKSSHVVSKAQAIYTTGCGQVSLSIDLIREVKAHTNCEGPTAFRIRTYTNL